MNGRYKNDTNSQDTVSCVWSKQKSTEKLVYHLILFDLSNAINKLAKLVEEINGCKKVRKPRTIETDAEMDEDINKPLTV